MDMTEMIVIGLASWSFASVLAGLVLGRAIGLRRDDPRFGSGAGDELGGLRVAFRPRDLVS